MQARIYFGSTKAAADYPPAYGGLQKGADDTSGGHFSKSNKAELCNGSTYDSDSYCLGSNPSSAANKKTPIVGVFLLAAPCIALCGRHIWLGLPGAASHLSALPALSGRRPPAPSKPITMGLSMAEGIAPSSLPAAKKHSGTLEKWSPVLRPFPLRLPIPFFACTGPRIIPFKTPLKAQFQWCFFSSSVVRGS